MTRITYSSASMWASRRKIVDDFYDDEVLRNPNPPVDVWRRSIVDHMLVLQLFPELTLQPGWMLRGYMITTGVPPAQFTRGCVWAVPESAILVPEILPPRDAQLTRLRPAGAIPVLEALVPPTSPESYLAASLLARAIRCFGSFDFADSWADYNIIDVDELIAAKQLASTGMLLQLLETEPWHEPRPTDWRPRVIEDGDTVRVEVYCYTPALLARIERCTDIYRRGTYQFTTETTHLVTREDGLIDIY
jgi:hypothetical protein